MKKYIILILFGLICSNTLAQIHKVIKGDTRYMNSYFKYPEVWWSFKSDLPDGKWICYYDSAMMQINYITHRKNGKTNGFDFTYRENDILVSVDCYKDNFLNGESRSYHKNGQLWHKGFYYNHKSIGEYIVYDSTGNIIRSDTFAIPKGIQYRKSFIPDTTINKEFILNSSPSFQHVFSVWQGTYPDLLEKDATLMFCNKSKSQYLMAYLNEKEKNQGFSCFEIGYIKALFSKRECLESDYSDFATENGVKLGMTRDKLLNVKGTDYYIMTENFVRYLIDDSGKVMTNQKSSPKYVLECEFEDDRVSWIKMGLCSGN